MADLEWQTKGRTSGARPRVKNEGVDIAWQTHRGQPRVVDLEWQIYGDQPRMAELGVLGWWT